MRARVDEDRVDDGIDGDASHHANTVAAKAEFRAILDDPDAFGAEEEVVELQAGDATDDAHMIDDAYGDGIAMRRAWYKRSTAGPRSPTSRPCITGSRRMVRSAAGCGTGAART